MHFLNVFHFLNEAFITLCSIIEYAHLTIYYRFKIEMLDSLFLKTGIYLNL